MKYKDDRIAYLEKAASNLEKELDATVLSANEMQKKLDEIKKMLRARMTQGKFTGMLIIES